MECPQCKHLIPEKSQRCLYCGFALDPGNGQSAWCAIHESRQDGAGGDGAPPGVSPPSDGEKPRTYRLDDLPDDLRSQVEQALSRTGQDKAPAEKVESDAQPGALQYDAATGKTVLNIRPGTQMTEEDIALFLSQYKTRHRAPLSKMVQMLIFLFAAGLAGVLMFLFM